MRTSLGRQAAYRLRYHQGNLKPGMSELQHPLAPPAWAAHFPASTARPSTLFSLTGTTARTTAEVRRVLTENDHGYDIFENPPRRYAHNHFAHSALSRYALGASAPLISADWEYDRVHLAPLDPVEGGREREIKTLDLPDKFTADNWASDKWYQRKGAYSRYIAFFHGEVARLGRDEAVRHYIFSPAGNGAAGGGHPRNLLLLYGGVLHPLLHIGFGLEFGDDVLVAEGLAQTCLHELGVLPELFPPGWPERAPLPEPASGYAPSLLDIYFEFCRDRVLDPGPYDPDALISTRLQNAVATPEKQARLRELAARWDVRDVSAAGQRRLQAELGFLTTLLTAGTSRAGRKPRIDFFLMHMLTSSLFVPSYLRLLAGDDGAQRTFLQGYLLACLHLAMSRGKPALFPSVIMGYTEYPAGPAPLAADRAADQDKLHAVGDPKDKREGNPWLRIVDNALVAHDSHVPKSIRSLLFYAQHAGDTAPGAMPGAKSQKEIDAMVGLTEDERQWWADMGAVDGTVFVRGAGALMDVLGWTKEGTAQGEWDRSALGWDGAWDGEAVTDRWHRKGD